MFNFKRMLLIAFFMPALLATGTQLDTLQFSLDEAMEYAIKNSYISRNSKLDVAAARKKVWETITIGLPQVEGSANYNAFLDIPVSLIPGEFVDQPGTYVPVKFGQDFSADVGIAVDQLIFDGSYLVGLKAARVYLDLARKTKEKTEIDIREAVANAYYYALVAAENRQLNQDNLVNTKRLLYEAKAYYDNGFREEQDVDQIRLMMKRAENEVLKADREIRVSKMVLKYTLGVDVNLPILLTDSLMGLVAPVQQAAYHEMPFDFGKHIDYRLQETQLSLKRSELSLEKVAFLPRVSGFFSYTKTAYANEFNLLKEKWFPSTIVGVQVTMPLFNSGMKTARVAQAKIRVEQAENQQLMNVQNLEKNYLTALSNLETALGQFHNDEENSVIARSIYDKTQVKFNNGLATSTELSQNEAQYLQAHGAYLLSALQLLQARIALQKSIGTL